MPSQIATADLTLAAVPPDLVVGASDVCPAPDAAADGESVVHGVDVVVRFAQTFNGYAWGGGPQELGTKVASVEAAWSAGHPLPGSLDMLRASLFLFIRAHRHAGGHPMTSDEAAWVNALLAAIRERLRG